MASLHKLLSDEGFERQNSTKPKKKVKFKDRRNRQDTVALPIYICHDRRSFDSISSWQRAEKPLSNKASSIFSSKREASGSEKSNYNARSNPRRDEPAIDDAAIKAMVSILSGYVGQYARDKGFRRSIRDKCRACFERRRKKHSDSEIFTHLELGIQELETLAENRDLKTDMDLESLQKSIKILKIVASLDSKGTSNDSACEKTNSYLTACAQLYLSIIYKIARNDKISARHLLQVFSESPNLARTHLLPELWEHFFLPHLLHLKIWYKKELDSLSSSGQEDRERRMKALKAQYNERMDKGTAQFASYYMEWLKVGAQAPSVPSVPVPSRPRSRRKSADSFASYHDSSDRSLYQAVFGPISRGLSMELGIGNGSAKFMWDADVEESNAEERMVERANNVEQKTPARRMSSSHSYRLQKSEYLQPESQKSDYFRFFGCRTEPVECLVKERYMSGNDKIINHEENDRRYQLNDLSSAIATICSSESLGECELAIRVLSEAWLNSNGDPEIETELSQASVIQGIMEILYVSNDDEILELAISILAELAKSRKNRHCILNSDPKLDVLLRLLRSSSLFLKAAVLLYLVKPKGKHMLSMDWIPLVLRVLEFGDQLQILFSVRCCPHDAAYYFLDQLLKGSHEDRSIANARQIISLGGLSLLVRRMDAGETCEKSKAASILYYCIRADGTCRHYLVKNLNKDAILSLLVLGKQSNSRRNALALLTELLCLNKRNQRIEFLTGLSKGWGCLNTMHIFLLLLHRGQPDERPIVAVVLLLLELLGDPPEHSVYREEAIDAIVKALDCSILDESVQEQLAKALLILGGQFSYTGEPEVEKWLVRKACLDENPETWWGEKEASIDVDENLNEERRTVEIWQRKAAMTLVTHGKRRLLTALANSIENSIPCLSRASLVTVCWMSCGLHSIGNKDVQIAACSILVPRLLSCLNDNATFEEKILASLSLYGLSKDTDDFWGLSRFEGGVVDSLHNLSTVTWAAKELILGMQLASTCSLDLDQGLFRPQCPLIN